MTIVEPAFDLMIEPEEDLRKINLAARTCYRSESVMDSEGYDPLRLPALLIKNGHEAMLEHASFSVRFQVSRAIANEIVRHRLCAFAQESQRYCNYSKDRFEHSVKFVRPRWVCENMLFYSDWVQDCVDIEDKYFAWLDKGVAPQNARGVLSNDVATTITVTANYREWRHLLQLRTAEGAHPDMRYIMKKLLAEPKAKVPVLFDDIGGDANV